jgi:hypothetical protein
MHKGFFNPQAFHIVPGHLVEIGLLGPAYLDDLIRVFCGFLEICEEAFCPVRASPWPATGTMGPVFLIRQSISLEKLSSPPSTSELRNMV